MWLKSPPLINVKVLHLFDFIEQMPLALLNLTQIERFFAAGGVILQALLVLGFILFSMMFARVWFRFVEFPAMIAQCRSATNYASFSRAAHQTGQALQQSMSLIRTTISVCPLLGLMGTVVGMIEIFDVIAMSGVANAQQLAAGVAKAILPTMAGMVIAISAMFMFAYIKRWVVRQRAYLIQLSLVWQQS